MTRTKKIVLGAVGFVAIGAAGGAIAATQLDSPSAQSAAIVTDAAGQLGVTPTALQNALVKAEENQIDAEVSSGQISSAQGDALKSALESGALPVVNVPGLGGGFRVGRGFGGVGPFDLSAAAAFLGLTAQQLQTDLQNGQSLADVAKAQGKTADDLAAALVGALKTKLDAAVTAGKLTSDQETKILAALQTQITNTVNGTHPIPGGIAPPGIGFGGFGGRGPGGSRGGAFFIIGLGNLSAAATFLRLTTDQIRTDLQNGQTLADIAKAQGKTADDLVTALVAAEKANLDKAVTAGDLTSDQETKILANAQTMITNQVNGTGPSFAGGPGMGFGPARHFRMHWSAGSGSSSGSSSSATTTG